MQLGTAVRRENRNQYDATRACTLGWVRRNRSRVGGRTAYNSIQVGKVGQNTGNAKGDGLGPWEVEKEVACGYGGRAWERVGKGGVGAGEV